VTAAVTGAGERHDDGTDISIPIRCADLDEVRACCAENWAGDFLIVLGHRIEFERAKRGAPTA
jgi:hypothetical protein